MRNTLVALLALLAACPTPSDVCNVDDDCPRHQVCALGACVDEPAGDGEGEGEGIFAGEGEGANTGEGEGANSGEGEGANTGEGEGEGASAGEGEGEGAANQPPSLAIVPGARGRQGQPIALGIVAADPEGDAITLRVGQAPANGSVDILANAVTYTSTVTFTGDDSFTIIPTDAHGLDGPAATATVHVLPSDWADVGMLARAKIDIDAAAAEQNAVVSNLAVYVALDDATIVPLARDAIRFADANQDSLDADLDHDASGELAYWVRVPTITGGVVQSIFAYAGGVPSSLSAPSAAGTWPDYVAVYHLTDGHDSTGKHPDLALGSGVSSTSCALGSCLTFDGNAVALIGAALFDLAQVSRCTLTASAIAAPQQAPTNDIVSWTVNGNPGVSRAFLAFDGQTNRFIAGSRATDNGTTEFTDFSVEAPVQTETRLDAVFDLPNQLTSFFQDGAPAGSVTVTTPNGAFPPTTSDGASIGGTANASFPFLGRVDEVRLALVARNADFLALDALSRAGQLSVVDATEQ